MITLGPGETKTEHFFKYVQCHAMNAIFRFLTWPLFYITTHPIFTTIINITVMLNVIVLCFDHWGISEKWRDINVWLNVFFTIVFILEILLKNIALSPKFFFRDPFNIFDFCVVLLSIVDIILSLFSFGLSSRLIRSCRILRVLKLIRSWPLLRRILTSVYQSGEELLYFLGITVTFMLVFSIVGMQFFRNKLLCEDEVSGELVRCRLNMNDFPRGLLLVFDFMTAENWDTTLTTAVDSTTYLAAVFFIIMLFCGNYILLAIFISILLSNVEHDHEEEAVQLLEDLQALSNDDNSAQNVLADQNGDQNPPEPPDPHSQITPLDPPSQISSKLHLISP
jgi:hypothetical protein